MARPRRDSNGPSGKKGMVRLGGGSRFEALLLIRPTDMFKITLMDEKKVSHLQADTKKVLFRNAHRNAGRWFPIGSNPASGGFLASTNGD